MLTLVGLEIYQYVKPTHPLSLACTSAPCCNNSWTTRTRLYPAARWRGVDCKELSAVALAQKSCAYHTKVFAKYGLYVLEYNSQISSEHSLTTESHSRISAFSLEVDVTEMGHCRSLYVFSTVNNSALQTYNCSNVLLATQRKNDNCKMITGK